MKTSRIVIIVLAAIILIPLFGRLAWKLKKNHFLDIIVVNKTVSNSSRNEFKALNWTLNFEKYTKSGKYLYNYKVDYYGFHPDAYNTERLIESFRLEEIQTLIKKYDALFFLDNAGVNIEGKGLPGSKNWYGGLNQNDYLLLKQMIANQKLVLAEYDFLSDQTEELVRYNTEQLIEIFSVGWKGKYFENLKSSIICYELSTKWIGRYKEYSGNDWSFEGPGIVILNTDQNRILVLPASEYMHSEFPVVKTSEETSKDFNIPVSAAYTGWFEIINSGKNTIISEFDLNLNEKGIEILYNNGMKAVFPAVISSPDKRFYYVAGDFSNSLVCMATSKGSLVTSVIMNISGKKTTNPDRFFQTYYNRLLSSILHNYYSEINKQD
jgi:hypothetical protein